MVGELRFSGGNDFDGWGAAFADADQPEKLAELSDFSDCHGIDRFGGDAVYLSGMDYFSHSLRGCVYHQRPDFCGDGDFGRKDC